MLTHAYRRTQCWRCQRRLRPMLLIKFKAKAEEEEEEREEQQIDYQNETKNS